MTKSNNEKVLTNEEGCIQSLMYKWRSRTLYTGPSYYSRNRKYVSHALLVDFDREFEITDLDVNENIISKMVLIPMNTAFKINYDREIFTVIYLDQYGLDFNHLVTISSKKTGGIYHGFDAGLVNKVCDKIKVIYENCLPIDEAAELFSILGFDRRTDLFEREGGLDGVDPRLVKVIDLLLNGHFPVNVQVEKLAEIAGISQSHLNNLFRQYVGGNFRTFRAQLQLHCFLMAQSFGKSQADAALEAGFVDQPHFSNRFKQVLGLKPKDYFSKKVKRKYFTDPEIIKRYKNEDNIYGAIVKEESE